MAATRPTMLKLKITAAAKTNLEPDMFLAPEINKRSSFTNAFMSRVQHKLVQFHYPKGAETLRSTAPAGFAGIRRELFEAACVPSSADLHGLRAAQQNLQD
jgi:hypothetical protein